MALAGVLGGEGLTADEIATSAAVTVVKKRRGLRDHRGPPDVTGKVPGADEAGFVKAAETAKANCPVSKVLNAEITMDASLAG